MNHSGGGKGGASGVENIEKDPMAWNADNENMAQERHVGPVGRDCISLGGGDRTSSSDNHGEWYTDTGGPATAPLTVIDATFKSAMNGTVCSPCPALPIGLEFLGVKTTNNKPPGTTVDGQHRPGTQDSQSNIATDVTAPGETTAKEGYPSNTGRGLGPPTVRNIHGTGNDDHT